MAVREYVLSVGGGSGCEGVRVVYGRWKWLRGSTCCL